MARGKFEYWLTEDGLTLLEGWARDGLTDAQLAEKMNIFMVGDLRMPNGSGEWKYWVIL